MALTSAVYRLDAVEERGHHFGHRNTPLANPSRQFDGRQATERARFGKRVVADGF